MIDSFYGIHTIETGVLSYHRVSGNSYFQQELVRIEQELNFSLNNFNNMFKGSNGTTYYPILVRVTKCHLLFSSMWYIITSAHQ